MLVEFRSIPIDYELSNNKPHIPFFLLCGSHKIPFNPSTDCKDILRIMIFASILEYKFPVINRRSEYLWFIVSDFLLYKKRYKDG